MKREFNYTGLCVPSMHYMADTSDKIEKIFQLVESGKYFTINRGRQYGKTTTINLLRKRLSPNYLCISITFQFSSDAMFTDEAGFSQEFLKKIRKALKTVNKAEAELWKDDKVNSFEVLSDFITDRCEGKTVVLIIDEADEASNNDLFVRFIKMLRDKYLLRNSGDDCTFQSVILAGVYDIRNLKMKMVLQGNYTPSAGEQMQNSPWNIAVDFDIDMSLSIPEIASMLREYENDYHTGMDIQSIAEEIRYYTSGYPYLVSRICHFIHNQLERNWTHEGVQAAIKLILEEKSTLFDDLFKKISSNEELSNLMFDLSVGKLSMSYSTDDPVVQWGQMFGFLSQDRGELKIHNKIFEIRIAKYFIGIRTRKWRDTYRMPVAISEIIRDGVFDMELCISKFQYYYSDLYRRKDVPFLERDGKLLFMMFLSPLINGAGFYHFESQTPEESKLDVVVDFNRQQFIIEMKLWYGESRHQSAIEQLTGYLKSKNREAGYLLTFDFRKRCEEAVPAEPQWLEHDGKRILDVILRYGEHENQP